DLETTGTEVVDRATEDGARLVRRLGVDARDREQRLDDVERVAHAAGGVSGRERGVQRRLELVRHERGEILERLVAPGELDRGTAEPLLGGAAADDRLEGRQRGGEPLLAVATAEDEDAGTAERQLVTNAEPVPVGGDEAERAVIRGRPPLDARGPCG